MEMKEVRELVLLYPHLFQLLCEVYVADESSPVSLWPVI